MGYLWKAGQDDQSEREEFDQGWSDIKGGEFSLNSLSKILSKTGWFRTIKDKMNMAGQSQGLIVNRARRSLTKAWSLSPLMVPCLSSLVTTNCPAQHPPYPLHSQLYGGLPSLCSLSVRLCSFIQYPIPDHFSSARPCVRDHRMIQLQSLPLGATAWVSENSNLGVQKT